jgi:NDP-sugar pyrophosphorylase family protein
MKAGIIAAGKGERLAQGGVEYPKPLVSIAGRPLIARTIEAAAHLNASCVACIVNSQMPEVVQYLRSEVWPIKLDLIVKTTPSSMESLFELAPLLADEPFIMFTVDAVFHPKTARTFVERACAFKSAKAVLALTPFVDDEKPLWVKTDHDQRIISMGAAARPGPNVTAGFYYFSPEIFDFIDTARERKLSALRQFLALLIEHGFPVYGIDVGKTMDVDYPEDIEKANRFIKGMAAHD